MLIRINDPTKEETKIYRNFIKFSKAYLTERITFLINEVKPDSLYWKATDLFVDWNVPQEELFTKLAEEVSFCWFARSIVWAYMRKHGITDLSFIDTCHKYSKVIDLFQCDGDYTEDLYVLGSEYFKELSELPLTSVTHIGWLYQYYNAELKDAFYSKNGKVESINDLIGATAIYTPYWIVRYLNENALGRVWISAKQGNNPELEDREIALKFGWKYFVETGEQPPEVIEELNKINAKRKDLTPYEIRYLEPCMGSGFFLINALDIMIKIYQDYGVDPKEALRPILKDNLAGADIDNKAWRLCKTNVLLRAWEYDNTILDNPIDLKLYCPLIDGRDINQNQVMWFGEDIEGLERFKAFEYINIMLNDFRVATQVGMLIHQSFNYDIDLMRRYINSPIGDLKELKPVQFQLNNLLDVATLLNNGSYHAVCTNPPYLTHAKWSEDMKDFIDNGQLHFGEEDPWEIIKDTLVEEFTGMINVPEKEEIIEEQLSFM